MAVFDPEDIKALEAEPKERVVDLVKGTIMELCIQLGESLDESSVENYINWLQDSIDCKNSDLTEAFETSKHLREMNRETLEAIRQDIKTLLLSKVPINPGGGDISKNEERNGGNSDDIISIDFNQFLYDDFNEVLRLQNVNSLHQCEDCKSTDTSPRPLISHSASVESLIQLFALHLPDLSEMKLLDIGCGLGSILYGAYFFSKASKIYGVELNASFCNTVGEIIDKYKLSDRLEIVNADLIDKIDLFNSCDVVTFNNVLEYFAPVEVQKKIWLFLRKHIKTGAIFVTNPDLVTLLSPLDLDSLIESWVVPLQSRVNRTVISGFPETDERFHLYRVISEGGASS